MNKVQEAKKEFSLFLLRIGIGILFLLGGFEKIFSKHWSASVFLQGSEGPFAFLYHILAGNPIVDVVIMWGLLVTGVALVLGLFVRIASLLGVVFMIFIYFAYYPPRHGSVDEHIIYLLVLIVLATFQSGKIWGLEKRVMQRFGKEKSWLQKLM